MKAVKHTHWEVVARAVYTEDYNTCAAAGNGSQSTGIEKIMTDLRNKINDGTFYRIEDSNVFMGYAIISSTSDVLIDSKIRYSKKDRQTDFDTFVNTLIYGTSKPL